MIFRFKNLVQYIIYFLIDILIQPSTKIKEKSILLIRLDAIGDYVLFRNYIELLKKSKKYKDYTITLLGNSVWKSLSEELDNEYIDNFIWLNKNKFAKNIMYRYKVLRKLAFNGYELIISPVYSRDFFTLDTIIKSVSAKEKIGSIGDLSNIKQWQKNVSDKYYDVLIPAKDELMFEFYRNKEFFENLLNVKLDIQKPHIELKQKNLNFQLPKDYAIVFIGANADFRKWDVGKFADVSMWIKEKYGYDIVLCGSSSDRIDALKFSKHFKGDYIDMVGKTSLTDLLYIIYNGKLIIANETSAPHFAVALAMSNIFVISNGNHYGRFTPYPKEISKNYHVIYHTEIEKNLNDNKKLTDIYGSGSNLNINDIDVEKVKQKINNLLKLNEIN